MRIPLVLVDDHEAVRRGIQRLLASQTDCFICGEDDPSYLSYYFGPEIAALRSL